LKQIDGLPRRVLALRRYIRKAPDLARQWTWSDADLARFWGTAQGRELRREIDKVVRKFEELNPGFTLGTSPPRTLQRQIDLWNANATVRAAANHLIRKCRRELSAYPEVPTPDATAKFRHFLEHSGVHPEPTSAAPGLSDHGQMHAIDFVVKQVRPPTVIADTVSATIASDWLAPRWDRKLKEAVVKSGNHFEGPLAHPQEPWHYRLRH
jgi:hypothetical protein